MGVHDMRPELSDCAHQMHEGTEIIDWMQLRAQSRYEPLGQLMPCRELVERGLAPPEHARQEKDLEPSSIEASG